MLDILFSKLYVISQLTIGPSYFLHRESCLLNSFAETQNMKYTMMIWKCITPYILRSATKNDVHDGKITCHLNAMKSGRPPDFLTRCRKFCFNNVIYNSISQYFFWLILNFRVPKKLTHWWAILLSDIFYNIINIVITGNVICARIELLPIIEVWWKIGCHDMVDFLFVAKP